MIVPLKRLEQLFSLLPATYDGFKPVFHYGDGVELNEFIKANDSAVYPLIYQTSLNCEINQLRDEAVMQPLDFFIAVLTNNTADNKKRLDTTYENVLLPLYENIMHLFEVCGIIRMTNVWPIEYYPKYSESPNRDNNFTIDVIDALRIRMNCTIENTCITKYIKF